MTLHERLHDMIFGSEDHLTSEQRDVVTYDDNAVVTACPGSGKTRALCARLAYRMTGWTQARSGIAALSFTNVAADEISNGIRELRVPACGERPHFIGTIDSFVFQHITGPHAATLFPGLTHRLELILPQTEDWLRSSGGYTHIVRRGGTVVGQVPISEFLLKPGGRYVWRKARHQQSFPDPPYAEVKRLKDSLARRGFMSHSDSMLYAHELLAKHPELASAIASRYPEIVIDECQDTSDVQHAIVSMLVATGKTRVLLVGDPYQAIYEWNDADPSLMLKRVTEHGWHEIKLTKNYRSSALICGAVRGVFRNSLDMVATGPDSECRITPLLVRYPDQRVGELTNTFRNALAAIPGGCTFSRSKIVARSNGGVRELRRLTGAIQSLPNAATMALLWAALSRDDGMMADAVASAEPTMCRILFGQTSLGISRSVLADISYRSWRLLMWDVVSCLPPASEDLPEWITNARNNIRSVLNDRGLDINTDISGLVRKPPNCPSIPANAVVAAAMTDGGITIETVHRVKGQSLDAVMLVASPRLGARARPSSVYRWIDGSGTDMGEEQRIAYVAMTRPKMVLMIALPESAWSDCAPYFSGFESITLDDLGPLSTMCEGCSRAHTG